MMPRAEARYPTVEAFRRAIETGWVAEDRLDHAPRRRETTGLLGALRRALASGSPASAGPAHPPLSGAGFTLAERLVEWRTRADGSGALDVTLALQRGLDGPARLRLTILISERGQRGKLSTQQIILEEQDARDFAAQLAELPRLGLRMTGEIRFEVERTRLECTWPGGRGPLALAIRTSGPRGGLKSCSISLDRRQVESLAAELQQGLRQVKPI
jgi:hypothetical protein